MNILDIFTILILGINILFGIWKGLIKQVFSLIGVVFGYILGISFYQDFAHFFNSFSSGISEIIAFFTIFSCCIIGAIIASYLLSNLLEIIGLSIVNRLGGAFIGFIKGAVIVSITALLLVTFLPTNNTLLTNSITLPLTLEAVEASQKVIPEDLIERFQKKMKALQILLRQEKISIQS